MRTLEWKETPSRRDCHGGCGQIIPKKSKFLRERVYQPASAGRYKEQIYNYCPVCAKKYIMELLENLNNIMDEIEELENGVEKVPQTG